MEKNNFFLDCFKDGFTVEGLTNGDRWNGWECPYFTYENAIKLVNAFSSGFLKYDSAKDIFISDSGNDDREEFEPVFIDGEKFYAIGAFSWCWLKNEEETEIFLSK